MIKRIKVNIKQIQDGINSIIIIKNHQQIDSLIIIHQMIMNQEQLQCLITSPIWLKHLILIKQYLQIYVATSTPT